MRAPQRARAGWYPDPRREAPYRYWNGDAWTARMRDRRPVTRRMVASVVVGALFGAAVVWGTGVLDKQLVGAGLNYQTCAENFAGKTMCGDQLVAFCRDSYDPEVNGEVCEPVLSDAGVDPQQLLDDRAHALRHRRAVALRAARTDATIGQESSDDGIAFTVRAVTTADVLPGAYEVTTPKDGRRFVVVDLTYRNDTGAPVDILCGGDGLALLDDAGRQFAADTDAMIGLSENQDVCGGASQPGGSTRATVVFEIPASVAPAQLLLWDSEKPGPAESGTFLRFRLGTLPDRVIE